nr:MAG TPA: hypothetical protein [Caudoviricetes sp.]
MHYVEKSTIFVVSKGSNLRQEENKYHAERLNRTRHKYHAERLNRTRQWKQRRR